MQGRCSKISGGIAAKVKLNKSWQMRQPTTMAENTISKENVPIQTISLILGFFFFAFKEVHI